MNFDGFSKDTILFFQRLNENNSKQWFNDHRDDFDNHVMKPAREFVVDLGEALKSLRPNVKAIPKTDQSIFRIHRDIRFSKDKRPYKTHLGIFFWEGPGKKMESPGFYFHLEPPNLMLGAGMYMFTPEMLPFYRDSVVHSEYGKDLAESVDKVRSRFAYELGGKHYKRTPRGYNENHPNAELLLYKGLHVGEEIEIPDALYSRELIDFCIERFRIMEPLHAWLVDFVERFAKNK